MIPDTQTFKETVEFRDKQYGRHAGKTPGALYKEPPELKGYTRKYHLPPIDLEHVEKSKKEDANIYRRMIEEIPALICRFLPDQYSVQNWGGGELCYRFHLPPIDDFLNFGARIYVKLSPQV